MSETNINQSHTSRRKMLSLTALGGTSIALGLSNLNNANAATTASSTTNNSALTKQAVTAPATLTKSNIAAVPTASTPMGPVVAGTPAFHNNPINIDINPPLRDAWKTNPFPSSVLAKIVTHDDIVLLNQITAAQKKQTWWTYAAQNGLIVDRQATTVNITSLAHTQPNFYSASTNVVQNGTVLHGYYVDIDWFKVTSGKLANLYVNTGCLHYQETIQNGQLPSLDLVSMPAYLRANKLVNSQYLNPQTAKQFVYMNAAWRSTFGTNMTINEGYRTLATQQQYWTQLGPSIAAKPGNSNHGLGMAMDIPNIFNYGTPGEKWINTYASLFGFNRPTIYDNTTNWEAWHINFVG